MIVGIVQSTAASAFFQGIYGRYLEVGTHVTVLMNKQQSKTYTLTKDCLPTCVCHGRIVHVVKLMHCVELLSNSVKMTLRFALNVTALLT